MPLRLIPPLLGAEVAYVIAQNTVSSQNDKVVVLAFSALGGYLFWLGAMQIKNGRALVELVTLIKGSPKSKSLLERVDTLENDLEAVQGDTRNAVTGTMANIENTLLRETENIAAQMQRQAESLGERIMGLEERERLRVGGSR